MPTLHLQERLETPQQLLSDWVHSTAVDWYYSSSLFERCVSSRRRCTGNTTEEREERVVGNLVGAGIVVRTAYDDYRPAHDRTAHRCS
jgi:hypothetical protein